MRLTFSHFDYWAHVHAPACLRSFATAGRTSKYDRTRALHACINDHAGVKVPIDRIVHLLKSHRKHAPSLLAYLIELGGMGWSFHNLPRRSAHARKWARRVALQTYGDNAETCRRLATAEATAQYRAGRSAAAYVPKEKPTP